MARLYRGAAPAQGYLKATCAKFGDKHEILIVFDEVTSPASDALGYPSAEPSVNVAGRART